MRMEVKFLDGTTEEATIIPGDTVLFERQYNMSAGDADVDPRIEHALFLAFVSLKRVGLSKADDFDTFLTLVEDIEPDAATAAAAELSEANDAFKSATNDEEREAARIRVAEAKAKAATVSPLPTPSAT